MSGENLRERYGKLSRLFELPPDDQRIENCSGGQQRRISFCVTIIHNPELLILDEPTVGLDPLLREKIWSFLAHETKTRNLTIIMSTHYIEEARQADRCGLMRNGVLAIEDSPKNILEKYQCKTLDDAFLKLCMSQETFYSYEKDYVNVSDSDIKEEFMQTEQTCPRNNFNVQRCRTLMKKNFLQLIRQPA